MDETQARLNITYRGQNGDLPDPVYFDTDKEDIRRIATEAVASGAVLGIPADEGADFTDFVVEYHRPNEGRDHNLIFLRPKAPFGT